MGGANRLGPRLYRAAEITNRPEPIQNTWLRSCARIVAVGTILTMPIAAMAESPPDNRTIAAQITTVRSQLREDAPLILPRRIVEAQAQEKIPEINTHLARLESISDAKKLLYNEDIADAFIKNPKRITDAIERIAKFISVYHDERDAKNVQFALGILGEETVGKLFVKYPTAFTSIAISARAYTWMAYDAISQDGISELFEAHPYEFVAMARSARIDAYAEFERLKNPILAEMFKNYPKAYAGVYRYDEAKRDAILSEMEKGTKTIAQTIVGSISLYDHVAIELGRTIDDLEDETERKERIENLQIEELVGLLCSNPELFNQATNRLLFERAKREADNGGATVLRHTYGLGLLQMRNMVFRALNNGMIDQLISGERKEQEIEFITTIILGEQNTKTGIYAEIFDQTYYYLMANGAKEAAGYLPELQMKITDQRRRLLLEHRTTDQEKIVLALGYLEGVLSGTERGGFVEKSIFDIKQYRDAHGRVNVVQIFDRDDTRGYHWERSKEVFEARYGKPKTSTTTTVIYETRGVNVVLYMGRTEEDNVEFVRKWITTHENGVVTFRGHSISLYTNMPADVFGNRTGRYLFIPGSCGSASSVPEYIGQNPNTDIRSLSYISTGYGNVTNAMVLMFLEEQQPIEMASVLQKNARRIERAGGDADLIRIWRPGEGLLNYIAQMTVGS